MPHRSLSGRPWLWQVSPGSSEVAGGMSLLLPIPIRHQEWVDRVHGGPGLRVPNTGYQAIPRKPSQGLADRGCAAAHLFSKRPDAGPGRACCAVLASCKRPKDCYISGPHLSLGQQFCNQRPATTPEEHESSMPWLSPGHERTANWIKYASRQMRSPAGATACGRDVFLFAHEPVPPGSETGASGGQEGRRRAELGWV